MSPTLVLIDGQCPMCVQSALRMRSWDTGKRLTFVNLHSAEGRKLAASRWSASELRSEMRVLLPDGSWRTGWYAWAALVSSFWWGTALAKVMRSPFFAAIGPMLYKYVAARRLTISRLLRLPPPCDDEGTCRLESVPL